MKNAIYWLRGFVTPTTLHKNLVLFRCRWLSCFLAETTPRVLRLAHQKKALLYT